MFFHLARLGLWLLVFTTGVVGCSKKPADEVVDAIDEALTLLSQSTPACQKAIETLEKIGRQNNDPRYLSILSSAYACRGGFSELTLFAEVDTISADFEDFLGSLAQLSEGQEDSAESARFNDLQTALDILLYAGGKTVPSAVQQQTVFGNRHANNMNLQILYMTLVQLGRFAYWYGNTDGTGAKGTGSSGNTCFMDYPLPSASAIAAGHASNACNGGNTGHPNVDYGTVTSAVARKRLCQGVMLVNNLVDILANTTLSTNDSLGDIAAIYDEIEPYITMASALDPDMPAFIENRSQTACEADTASDDSLLQLYFAALFERALP